MYFWVLIMFNYLYELWLFSVFGFGLYSIKLEMVLLVSIVFFWWDIYFFFLNWIMDIVINFGGFYF